MGLLKKKTEKTEQREQMLKKAYVLPEKLGNDIIILLNEMPIKHAASITPILQAMINAPRGDINITYPVPPPLKEGSPKEIIDKKEKNELFTK